MNKYLDNYSILKLETKIKESCDGYYSFEETVFYGEKGGMLKDEGTINGLKVIDLKYEDDILWHKVDGELMDPIYMEVDAWTRNINTTVQSALHILDGYYAKMDAYIPSVGVNPDNEWFEVNIKNLDDEHLNKVEEYMNEVIARDIPVTIKYINGKDYDDPKYQQFDELRIVSFGDLDTQPCGTLHVNSTKDINSFIILSKEKTSRGTKVHFACGNAVSLLAKKDHMLLEELSKNLGVNIYDLNDKATEMNNNLKALKKEVNDLKTSLIEYKAKDLVNSDSVTEYICNDAGELRMVSNALSNMVDDDRILYSTIDNVLNVAVLSKGGNARNIFKQLQEQFGINGGGSPKVALGKYAGEKNIVNELKEVFK